MEHERAIYENQTLQNAVGDTKFWLEFVYR